MAVILYSQLIAFFLLIAHCITGQYDELHEHRHRRQMPDPTYRNPGAFQPKPDLPMSMGNNAPFMPMNNQNMMPTNTNLKPVLNNEQLLAASPQQQQQRQQPQQQQMDPMRSGGYYNSPSFQQSPFSGQKPVGWFGTNNPNWVSSRDSEVDKNKLAAAKNPQMNK